MSESLFERNGQFVVATDLARGPWDRRFLHGGPVSALLAGAANTCTNGDPTFGLGISRLTVELERPVPAHKPLRLASQVTRSGKKIELVDTQLLDGDTILARARAMKIRRTEVDLGDDPTVLTEPPPRFVTVASSPSMSTEWQGFHNAANEHRFLEGSWTQNGPAVVWVRLRCPVFEGEPVLPLQRVAAAADFGNGVSSVVNWETHTFINPDLSVHVHRDLVGEWVCMRTKTHVSDVGTGFAESELFDENGRLGRSVQSLLVESR